ncbi:hypothetical protein E1264_36820 [Actinomadura sp. KC216]|uniref:FAD-dependent oxidoreductase n=1 Tax=Actinomadura sp. KC216 TaxID=2530370 RepID=UPI00104EE052|nr:FAD-dependent oxidoreductase [Actinomadura sp. KC216]TDB78401.1 hypothetical protein E1264_36820 [Actinomadura sp. KC216]
MRIAIAGAGIAGLCTAWLLDPVHEVVVFESQPRIGGHVLTLAVPDGPDGQAAVDVGAQHIAPGAFRLFSRLLRELRLAAQTFDVPLSTTLMHHPYSTPLLVSPHASSSDRARSTILGDEWAAVGRLVSGAAEWAAEDNSWATPLSELIEPLPVTREHKDMLLYPLLASFFGCDTTQVKETSARAATAFLIAVPPATDDDAPVWHNLHTGLGAVAGALAAQLERGRIRTDLGVKLLRRVGDQVEVTDSAGRSHTVDRIVLATHPDEAARVIAPLPGTDRLVDALNTFTYVDVLVAAHTDPAYMPPNRRHWSTNNVTVHDGWAETSTWYGAAGVDVFKSWVTHRDRPPRKPVAQASFRQLCLTPAAVRARPQVIAAQGEGGVHFAGHHLHHLDSQESALASAVDVARTLAPAAPRLERLLK